MGLVIGVVGASGGLGASTLACALAGIGARDGGVAVAVDGRVHRGRLDVTACCEHVEGYRWGDLTDLSGRTDGRRLLGRLPLSDGVRVLAAGRGVPAPDVVHDVVGVLRDTVDLMVLDLGLSPPTDVLRTIGATDVLLVVCGLTARRLVDGDVLVAFLVGRPGQVDRDTPAPADRIGLLTRGPRRTSDLGEHVAHHLDLPFVGHLPDDPRVALDEVRGRMPGSHSRSPFVRAADRACAWAATVSARDVDGVRSRATGPVGS